MTLIWLYAASLICGFTLGAILMQARSIFYGVFSMALIAVLVFSGVLVSPALLNRSPILDVVLLIAFQQSFARLIAICVLGYMGAWSAVLLKLFSGRL